MNASGSVKARGRLWPVGFLVGVVALVVLGVRLLPARAEPALVTFNVNSTLDQIDADTGDGLCQSAPGSCTLRAAVMQANTISGQGTQIVLPAGTYTLTRPATGANGPDTGDLNLTTPANGNPVVTISGAGATTTIIDANGLDRAFYIHSDRRASLSGVTIQNGYIEDTDGSASGGGIFNFGDLEIYRSVIHHNMIIGDIATGGGIASGGTLIISESVVRDNEVVGGNTGSGGGLYNFGRLDVDLRIEHHQRDLFRRRRHHQQRRRGHVVSSPDHAARQHHALRRRHLQQRRPAIGDREPDPRQHGRGLRRRHPQ
jgi:hypothetical protein